MLLCACSVIDHRCYQNVVRAKNGTDALSTLWHLLWSIIVWTHNNMESILYDKIRKMLMVATSLYLPFIPWHHTLTSRCIDKDVFLSCHKCGTKKKFWVPIRNQTSDLYILRSDALPLSHRDSTVSKVNYEVHMTHVLHTARISMLKV